MNNKAKTYNAGVESGLRVAQKIIEQEVEAMDYLKSKVDLVVDGHNEMKSAVDSLIEDADENAIAKIFGICNAVRPNELKEHEQKMLINIIATLCASGMNDAQKKYYNNLRHHLNIKGYEPDVSYDFRRIESIESVTSVKVIAKAVRIYLFLEESNFNGIYRHEDDLFSYFELRSFDEIDAIIETINCLFGTEGLTEFYGDFGGNEVADENSEDSSKKTRVSARAARFIFENYAILPRLISDNYIIVEKKKDGRWLIINKDSAYEREYCVESHTSCLEETVSIHDCLFFFEESRICKLELGSLTKNILVDYEINLVNSNGRYEAPKLEAFANKYVTFSFYGGDNEDKHGDWVLDIESNEIKYEDKNFNYFRKGYFSGDRFITYIENAGSVSKGYKDISYNLAEYIPNNDKVFSLSDSFGKHKERTFYDPTLGSPAWRVSVFPVSDKIAGIFVISKVRGKEDKVYTFDISNGKRLNEFEAGVSYGYSFYFFSNYMVYVDLKKIRKLEIIDLLTGKRKHLVERNRYLPASTCNILDEWVYFRDDKAGGHKLISIVDFMSQNE